MNEQELNPLETAHKVIENFKSLLEARNNRIEELEKKNEILLEAVKLLKVSRARSSYCTKTWNSLRDEVLKQLGEVSE